MNNTQLYLAWLRTTSPEVYMAAMRKITGQKRTLGGLDADLCASMTAPSTFGAFGQDDSSFDYTMPEIDITAPVDTTTYTLPVIDETSLTPVTPIDTSVLTPVTDIGTTVTMPDVTITPAPATSSPFSSNVLAAFTTAVGTVAASALQASNQSNLIKLNTARAQQGLPPVNSAGQVVTPTNTRLAPATGPIYKLESTIAGAAGGVGLPLLLGVGVLAFFMLRRR